MKVLLRKGFGLIALRDSNPSTTPKWAQWAIAASILVIVVPIVGTAILGGNQVRCVGVDAAGEVVKARGEGCDRLDQVVYTELGPDGQIQYSGDLDVESGP